MADYSKYKRINGEKKKYGSSSEDKKKKAKEAAQEAWNKKFRKGFNKE